MVGMWYDGRFEKGERGAEPTGGEAPRKHYFALYIEKQIQGEITRNLSHRDLSSLAAEARLTNRTLRKACHLRALQVLNYEK